MPRPITVLRSALPVLVLSLAPVEARAQVQAGQAAPYFAKYQLDSPAMGQTTLRDLDDYAGKVLFIFLLGWNCQVCVPDGPKVEQEIWQYYQTNRPGQVQVIGADVYDGTEAQLRGFRQQTGTTYPLLLRAMDMMSGTGNMSTLYGPNDSHVIVNKQGIVRLNSYPMWAHGSRYRLTEFRACIDSLVTQTADVDDPVAPRGFALASAPNPFAVETTIDLSNPVSGLPVQVDVYDVRGRRVAGLWSGPTRAGVTRIEWDGRDGSGAELPAGVYLLRASFGGTQLTRRLIRVR